jgi:hypothetical protein
VPERDEAAPPGRSIIVAAWATFALFAVTIVPDAAGWHALDNVAAGVALGFFVVSLPLWLYAFGVGVMRQARGENVGVGSLFFLTGSAPTAVRRRLLGALVASLVLAAIVAFANAFAVLEPMLPFALVGLWSARHGEFGQRDLAARAPGAPTGLQQGRG